VRKKLCRLLFVCLGVVSAAAAPHRPRILGVSHLTLYVHDVEASRAYYTKLLGYREPSPGLIRISRRQYLELVTEREAGGDRLAKVGVETDDADAMRAYLKSRGIAVPESVGKDRLGSAAFDATDPDGHIVTFVQYAPDGWLARQQGGRSDEVSTDMRHIGILVGALETAMRFYRDVLEFKEIWRGSRDEKELNWVNMQVPDGEDYVEFMLYRDLPEPSKRGTQHHLCLFVPDIERSLATLHVRAAGAGYARPMEIRTGTNRKRQLNLYDPDGTRTELMEPTTVDGKPAPSSSAPPPRRN
jgi:catechol 2,3-dioxygenase-like lactoylglutathione lyase family enzyme